MLVFITKNNFLMRNLPSLEISWIKSIPLRSTVYFHMPRFYPDGEGDFLETEELSQLLLHICSFSFLMNFPSTLQLFAA